MRDGDRVLIAEGCTHHRQEDDIGTVKIPRLMGKKTGRRLVFEHAAGMRYPADLASYALVVHCGGCMLNRREMLHRIASARAAGVPIVNKGYAEDAMAAARKAGASGGTILGARGTASEADARFFGVKLVPEKELLLILTPVAVAEAVFQAVRALPCFAEKGSGIEFSVPVRDFTALGR